MSKIEMVDIDKDKIDAGREAALTARQQTLKAAKKRGLTYDLAILRLKQSLIAKKTKTIKLKGSVSNGSLPKGFKVIAKTGVIINTDDDQEAGSGECLVQWNEVSHSIRLRATDLALQVLDSFPNKRLEHSGIDGEDIRIIVTKDE